jgi:tRNA threonylcarbamoyladenosine biosynthesis protein TsaE
MSITLHSSSPQETFGIGVNLGRLLKGHELILLSGDMGVGKTLFSKGIAQSININPGEVVSPTFTLMNHFQGKFQLFHIDLYRLEGSSMINLPEIDENLGDGIILVEWAQYLDKSYFKLHFSLKIEFILGKGDTSRRLKIQGPEYINLSHMK